MNKVKFYNLNFVQKSFIDFIIIAWLVFFVISTSVLLYFIISNLLLLLNLDTDFSALITAIIIIPLYMYDNDKKDKIIEKIFLKKYLS
jgi:ABC-type multidrug transport system permease subunit